MRPVTLTTDDASVDVVASAVCPMDYLISPFQVTLEAIVTGAATYTVEYTTDNPFAEDFDPATAHWIPVTNMTAAAADAEATLISPVRAIRMRQLTGAGSMELQITQAGMGN